MVDRTGNIFPDDGKINEARTPSVWFVVDIRIRYVQEYTLLNVLNINSEFEKYVLKYKNIKLCSELIIIQYLSNN